LSSSDPFGERGSRRLHRTLRVLGGQFLFESNSRKLLALVDQAFAGLPAYRLAAATPKFTVSLTLHRRTLRRRGLPPPPRLSSGAGHLRATVDAENFATVFPAARSACVSVSSDQLRHSHLVRYELIEFAVLTLAARSQGLVALHAGCVGARGKGVLLVGDSGAGKSTVALAALLAGLDYLAEDSVFVCPDSLRALAAPQFLHLRSRSLAAIAPRVRPALRRAARIRRRSGERKYAINLRRLGLRVARGALALSAVVFLSRQRAPEMRLLRPVERRVAVERLRRLQPYAAARPEWRRFSRKLARMPAYELRRGAQPSQAAAALRTLLRAR